MKISYILINLEIAILCYWFSPFFLKRKTSSLIPLGDDIWEAVCQDLLGAVRHFLHNDPKNVHHSHDGSEVPGGAGVSRATVENQFLATSEKLCILFLGYRFEIRNEW